MTKIRYGYDLHWNKKIVIATALAIMMLATTVTAISPAPTGDALDPIAPAATEGPIEDSVHEALQAFCGVDEDLVESLGVPCPQPALEETWTAFHDGYGWRDQAQAIVVSPDGSTIYVAGNGRTGTSYVTQDFVAVAYRDDGTELWVARYDGPANDKEFAHDIAIDPDGETVFVTGTSAASDSDYATVAYNATTGEELWVARYDGPGNDFDQALDLVVSPDGSRVFVTGDSYGMNSDATTIAYDADSGVELWVARYNGPPNHHDRGYAVAVSPDGSHVYVAGVSYRPSQFNSKDAFTVSYDADSGAELWAAVYDAGRTDGMGDVAVSPDGSRVYVTGATNRGDGYEFLTLAYDAHTGDMVWESDAGGSGGGGEYMVLSRDGTSIFVLGKSRLPSASSTLDYDLVTTAIDARTGVGTTPGSELWRATYDRAETFEVSMGIAMTPNGETVFITGWSRGTGENGERDMFATVAYDTASGAELSVGMYDHGRKSEAYAIAVSPAGDRVYVAGLVQNVGYEDFGTIAYAWELTDRNGEQVK